MSIIVYRVLFLYMSILLTCAFSVINKVLIFQGYFSLGFNLLFIYLQDARGNDVDLSIYKGKVLLIVNVASLW